LKEGEVKDAVMRRLMKELQHVVTDLDGIEQLMIRAD
jgi:hypothetical protein